MKYPCSFLSFVLILLLASCGGSSSQQDKQTNTSGTNFSYPAANNSSQPSAQTTPGSGNTQNPAVQTAPGSTLPISITPGGVTQQQTPVTVNTTTPVTGKGLNPEHGKPGHRCDIAVGAPLDSKPAATNTAAPTIQASPVTVQPSPVAVNTTAPVTGKGLNPEHGKPGHRCAIAVGAPLDSKPVVADASKQAAPVNLPNSPIPQPTPIQPGPVQPVNANPAPVVATGAGLNPEHGKPGHRCDIAVGAPLDSKPKQ